MVIDLCEIFQPFYRLSKGVSHVIYQDGQEKVKQKALEYNCRLVSVLWVVKCEELEQKVDEVRVRKFNHIRSEIIIR